MTVNGKDPLLKSGPDQQRKLFDRFTKEANGFSTEEVIGAAVNLMINALRQAYSTRRAADIAFDELMGRSKGLLMQHYNHAGRRSGIFPFHQIIHAPLVTDKDGF